jgi:hypothetical protein
MTMKSSPALKKKLLGILATLLSTWTHAKHPPRSGKYLVLADPSQLSQLPNTLLSATGDTSSLPSRPLPPKLMHWPFCTSFASALDMDMSPFANTPPSLIAIASSLSAPILRYQVSFKTFSGTLLSLASINAPLPPSCPHGNLMKWTLRLILILQWRNYLNAP